MVFSVALDDPDPLYLAFVAGPFSRAPFTGVLTKDAVKGLGDGNQRKGIQRAYDMMDKLEVKVYFKHQAEELSLQEFVKKKSAWISQETLYGYLKTRMGAKYVLMFEDEIFLGSINKAKWNIYAAALQDLTFYSISYLKKTPKT